MFMKNISFFLKGYKRFLLWLLLLYITLSIQRYFTPLQYLKKKNPIHYIIISDIICVFYMGFALLIFIGVYKKYYQRMIFCFVRFR